MSIAIKLEIFRNVLTGIAEEMGVRLQRSAYSSNIKERRDYSCALFDCNGQLAAQAAHIPVHLGSMPLLVEKILQIFNLQPGDTVIANDPFAGGTHLPDVTLVEPIFYEDKLWGFAAARAHHSDIGGMAAGSMPDSTRIYQEGVIIPPMLLRKQGEINNEVLHLITRNTRTPVEREGDFYAQLAALAVAQKRVAWMIGMYGFDESLELVRELISYSERMTRAALKKMGTGSVWSNDYLEDDRTGENVLIQANIDLNGGEAVVDFKGADRQRDGNFNAPLPVTLASVYYVFRCLLGDDIPANAGCFKPITVLAPEGSIVNAQHPYAVAAGNVETSQRIVDVLMRVLAQLFPDRISAASHGSMNNVAIGGFRNYTGESFAYYETIGGGAGAGPHRPGASAIHTHMTNTRNTPVEALESTYPFRVTRYTVRTGSGGEGLHRGGDGIIREYEFLMPCQVSIMSERRRLAPFGIAGGEPGKPGKNRLLKKKTGESEQLPGKTTFNVEPGDIVTIETPGGGGWGKPILSPVER